jgi:DNA processing protein
LGNSTLDWVALNLALSPCTLTLRNLLDRFGDPAAIRTAPPGELARVNGMTGRLAARLTDPGLAGTALAELERARRQSIRILVRNDPEYPAILAQLPDPPPLLYMRGDLRVEDDPAVAVVGSRRATAYGLEMARRIASGLAEVGITVVSGMARGIDEAAHLGALEAGGRTLAFLGSGLDRLYPPESRRLAERIAANGAVLSEFPLGTAPRPGNFPVRNRLISGVSRGTVVVEAARRSGSLITARMALEQGREVLAVPGRATTETARGTNRLIQEGAKLVTTARDVLEEIPGAPLPPEPEEAGLADDAGGNMILSRMPVDETVGLEDLIAATGMEAGKLLASLLELEMDGRIRPLPGGRYLRRGRRSEVG